MRDELSIFFENAATDPLGHDGVEGKVTFAPEKVILQFKQKDRAFKKHEAQQLELDYSEIESVQYQSPLLGPKLLSIATRGTAKRLKAFPGAEVSRVVLQVLKSSRDQASKAADYVEYRLSEAYLKERERNLSDLRGESGL